MPEFIKISENVYRAPVTFPGCWAGVYLVLGKENILVDTGGCAETVDSYIVPALEKLGLTLQNIGWMAITHIHGDHVGGAARIKQLAPHIKTACFKASCERMLHPRDYSAQIRAAFPGQSAPVPAVLDGVQPDLLLEEGDMVGDLVLIHTPGHDTDACSYYDPRTRTLLTGDSLQLNGTVSQGCQLLMDAAGYAETIRKLKAMKIEYLACGHPYLPLGADAVGSEQVRMYLDACEDCLEHDRGFIHGMMVAGVGDPVQIAKALIREVGGQEPKFLFLPLYTVTQLMHEKERV